MSLKDEFEKETLEKAYRQITGPHPIEYGVTITQNLPSRAYVEWLEKRADIERRLFEVSAKLKKSWRIIGNHQTDTIVLSFDSITDRLSVSAENFNDLLDKAEALIKEKP